MARSRARKLADLSSAGSTFDDGVISASEVTGLGTAATTDTTAYATAGQGTLAASALQSGGGSVTGNVTFGDNNKAIFGAGSDLQVYSTGANGFVENNTGLLILKNNSDNRDIALQSDDGSGGVANYLLADGSTGALNAYHYGDLKLATTSTGIDVTGTVKPTTYQETYVANATGATTTLDLSTGTNFSVTLTTNTTFAFSNPPSSGTAYAFTLVITQPSTAVTIAWPSSVDWAGGTAPDAPGNSEVNAYGFMTRDGGTTYYGFLGGAALG